MTPLDPPMSVCYECSRSTSGRCWRHRNVDLVNVRPAPSNVDPMTTETAAMFMRQRDEAWAEVERLREQLELRRLAKIECEKANERLREALAEIALTAHEHGSDGRRAKAERALGADPASTSEAA